MGGVEGGGGKVGRVSVGSGVAEADRVFFGRVTCWFVSKTVVFWFLLFINSSISLIYRQYIVSYFFFKSYR